MSVAAAPGLGAVLSEQARALATSPATILPRGWRHRSGPAGYRAMSYAQLDRRSDALAAGLSAIGIGPGVRTAFLVPPSEAFFTVAFALLKAGAVPVLVDPGIGRRNMKGCLDEAAPKAFIGVPKAHAARRLLGWSPSARLLVTVGPAVPGGGHRLSAVQRSGQALLPFTPPPREPGAVAAVAFTSGSTGPPKGVEYRTEHFLAQLAILRALYDLTPGEVSLATFPPFALLGPLLGLTTVVPRMDPTRPAAVHPRRLAEAANTFGATIMFGSPALLDTLSRWGEASGGRIPALRRVISAGAPVSRAVQRRTLAMIGPDAQVHTPYGATEALPVTSIGSRELLDLPADGICVGSPVPGVDLAVMKITDGPMPRYDDRLRAADGEIGEILVRGPNVTLAYADRPQATARAKTNWDGQIAHRMGDVGWLDPAGRLWYAGRLVHRVTTSAGTLFSVPCEEIFNSSPAVARSALVGVGPAGRQRPVICIQLEPGNRPSPALTSTLLDLAAGDPRTETIRTLLYRRRFPVDIRHNAKIDREALGRWAAEVFGPRR